MFHLLINIPGESALIERKSAWRRQYAGKPILMTLLSLPNMASCMSSCVISPWETNVSPNWRHSLHKPSNNYRTHMKHLFSIYIYKQNGKTWDSRICYSHKLRLCDFEMCICLKSHGWNVIRLILTRQSWFVTVTNGKKYDCIKPRFVKHYLKWFQLSDVIC